MLLLGRPSSPQHGLVLLLACDHNQHAVPLDVHTHILEHRLLVLALDLDESVSDIAVARSSSWTDDLRV